MVPADSRRISRDPRYSGSRAHAATLRVRGSHPLRPAVPGRFRSRRARAHCGPTTPAAPQGRRGFGLFPGRSPLLGESLLFSLPAGTKMFQFPAFAPHINAVTGIRPAGFSHSEIRGSRAICAYPRLIAAYHVLHRLREPRHPPCALLHFSPVGATVAPRVLLQAPAAGGARSYFQLFRLARGRRPARADTAHITRRLILQSCFVATCQRSISPEGERGEYRTRTDDPLLAKRVL